ncbi:MAG: ABC transporter ATP-binding protein [Firmicutes bacterium]|nr:ABC transporter ATP-binding protein [Bacillota bacterium]
MNGIEVKNISKRFGDILALDDVSLCFEENKIYGLLGRNGAGKTTLLNAISNRIFPDQGEIYVSGLPATENDKAQQQLFLMSEKTLYPERMKIKEVFYWTKSYYPNFDLAYAESLADKFQLDTKKRVRSLSTGYSSIFKIILALSANTPYLLLDEPVLGLDANHRDLFYKLLIEKYSSNPCTIVISTHLIEEVSGIIEDIVIIKQGKIICRESCESLLSKGYTVSGKASLVDTFIEGKKVIGADTLGGLKTAYILGSPAADNVPSDLEVTRMDLQKLFIQLTNS